MTRTIYYDPKTQAKLRRRYFRYGEGHELSCSICGGAFITRSLRAKYCSSQCRNVRRIDFNRERGGCPWRPKKPKRKLNCEYCGVAFVAGRSDARCCGQSCASKAYKVRVDPGLPERRRLRVEARLEQEQETKATEAAREARRKKILEGAKNPGCHGGGYDPRYLARRLYMQHPAVFARLAAGEFYSFIAAARAAGIVPDHGRPELGLRRCSECGATYEAKRINARYCSPLCKSRTENRKRR